MSESYDCIIVGAFKYPAGDASANRLLSIAKTFAASGRKPLVFNDSSSNPRPAPAAKLIATYGGIDYVSLPPSRDGRIARLIHRLTRPIRLVRALRALGASGAQVEWVSVASGLYTLGVHLALHSVAGKQTVVDIVERHDPHQFSHGRLDIRFWRHRWTSWLCKWLPDRVIVISSALESRYSKMRDVLVLPPAIDGTEYGPRETRGATSGRLLLLYIGKPDNKDLLGLLLRAVLEIDAKQRRRIRVVIAGPTRQDLIANRDVGESLLAQVEEFVEILGYLPRRRVCELLAVADFTFLLRPEHGYAAAGFPSKVPESLAAGCPVMVNLTSDLGAFLSDGKDSLICYGTRPENIERLLARALELDSIQLEGMSAEARATAARCFAYEVWAGPLNVYLQGSRPHHQSS